MTEHIDLVKQFAKLDINLNEIIRLARENQGTIKGYYAILQENAKLNQQIKQLHADIAHLKKEYQSLQQEFSDEYNRNLQVIEQKCNMADNYQQQIASLTRKLRMAEKNVQGEPQPQHAAKAPVPGKKKPPETVEFSVKDHIDFIEFNRQTRIKEILSLVRKQHFARTPHLFDKVFSTRLNQEVNLETLDAKNVYILSSGRPLPFAPGIFRHLLKVLLARKGVSAAAKKSLTLLLQNQAGFSEYDNAPFNLVYIHLVLDGAENRYAYLFLFDRTANRIHHTRGKYR